MLLLGNTFPVVSLARARLISLTTYNFPLSSFPVRDISSLEAALVGRVTLKKPNMAPSYVVHF